MAVDLVGCAVKVMRIATGEIEDDREAKVPNRAKDGKARAELLSSKCRREISRSAADARWAAQYSKGGSK